MKINKNTKQALSRLLKKPKDKPKSKKDMQRWLNDNIRSGKLGMKTQETLAGKESDVPHICSQCSTYFKNKESYRMHNKKVHQVSSVHDTQYSVNKSEHNNLEEPEDETETYNRDDGEERAGLNDEQESRLDEVSVDPESSLKMTLHSSEQKNSPKSEKRDIAIRSNKIDDVEASVLYKLEQKNDTKKKIGIRKKRKQTCECCAIAFTSRKTYEQHLASKFFGSLP